MADEEGEISPLTRTGEAVVRRIQSNRESYLASTGAPRIPAARQSQIIRDCFQICSDLLTLNAPQVQDLPVSMDRASSLILDTLLILQDERRPPRHQLCLGLGLLDDCRERITRIRNPEAIPLKTLDVMVTLRQPVGSYAVSAISMFPVIRGYDHPRLCAEHEEMLGVMLNNVLLSTAFLEGVNAHL